MSNKLQKSNSSDPGTSKSGKFDLASINSKAHAAALGIVELPRLFHQLVVFVIDGSGSMSYDGMTGESKGKEVESSIKEVIRRLQKSKNKNSFDISIYAYANESKEILSQASVDSVNLNQSLNPLDYIDEYGRSSMNSTLEAVSEESEAYLSTNEGKNAQVLVLLLSDGALHEYEQTHEMCNQLKAIQKVTVSSVFFESSNWQEDYPKVDIDVLKTAMKNLATDSTFFASTVNPEEIRKHMIKSISTVSKID